MGSRDLLTVYDYHVLGDMKFLYDKEEINFKY